MGLPAFIIDAKSLNGNIPATLYQGFPILKLAVCPASAAACIKGKRGFSGTSQKTPFPILKCEQECRGLGCPQKTPFPVSRSAEGCSPLPGPGVSPENSLSSLCE